MDIYCNITSVHPMVFSVGLSPFLFLVVDLDVIGLVVVVVNNMGSVGCEWQGKLIRGL